MNYNKVKKIGLLAGDAGVFYLSLYLTLLLRYWPKPIDELWQSHLAPFSVIFAVWLLIFYISNLYDLNLAANNIAFFKSTGRSLAVGGLLAILFFYLTPEISIAPKRNLFIFILVFAVIFYLWRQFFNWSLKAYLPKNNIAFIGLNSQVKELIEEFQAKPHLGFTPTFIIDEGSDQEEFKGIKIFNKIGDLPELIKEQKVVTLVLSSNSSQSDNLRSILFQCLPLKINYISLPNFYESISGKIPVEMINQTWFLENLNEGGRFWFDFVKNLYDFALALTILILTIILWPIIGLIIKITSAGPIFFKQTRVGKNNLTFTIIKFRTMTVANNDHAPTRKQDQRVTKFGLLLRKTRIDELPQVVNILKSEMSFVGPRPERPELIKDLEKNIPFYQERTLVKPGITGWDQVSGEYHSPSQEDTLKKLQYDLFYIKNRSIYLDLSIILKTIATILSRRGV